MTSSSRIKTRYKKMTIEGLDGKFNPNIGTMLN